MTNVLLAAKDQTIDLPGCLKLDEELPVFGVQLKTSFETTALRNIWTLFFFYMCVSTWCFALLDMFCFRGSWLMNTSCKRTSLLRDGINFNILGGLPREVLFHPEWAKRSWLSLVLAFGQFPSLDIVPFSAYSYFVKDEDFDWLKCFDLLGKDLKENDQLLLKTSFCDRDL